MRKNNKFLWIALVALVAALIYIFLGENDESSSSSGTNLPVEVKEPLFVDEGDLWFIRSATNDTIKQVDIEVADDNQQRAQGMMFRSDMPYTRAMLFIFEEAKEQSFWMKNTKLSLDILYVSANQEIISIYKHTQPFSENPIPSFGDAQYVVETKAGFCKEFGIVEGDRIEFTLAE